MNKNELPKTQKRRKILWIAFTFFVLILISIVWFFGIESMEQYVYDGHYKNDYVSAPEQISRILSHYKKTPVGQLPKSILKSMGLDKDKYSKMTQGQCFYLISKKDVYKKIVGDFRIKDFYSKDIKYYSSFYFSDDTLYWGIDERILYKVLELQDVLEKKGYDRNAFSIRFGHRSPFMNETIGGASKSRHILGEAVDMAIGDINKDERYTDKDKQIVIDLCEKYVIKNQGGLGLYPGTRTVHMDVRGYRARWNDY